MPSWGGVALVTGLILVVLLADLALAGSVRGLRFSRAGTRLVRPR